MADNLFKTTLLEIVKELIKLRKLCEEFNIGYKMVREIELASANWSLMIAPEILELRNDEETNILDNEGDGTLRDGSDFSLYHYDYEDLIEIAKLYKRAKKLIERYRKLSLKGSQRALDIVKEVV